MAYLGWEKEQPGTKRNKLKNPIYFVHGESGEDFWSALERHLSRVYATGHKHQDYYWGRWFKSQARSLCHKVLITLGQNTSIVDFT